MAVANSRQIRESAAAAVKRVKGSVMGRLEPYRVAPVKFPAKTLSISPVRPVMVIMRSSKQVRSTSISSTTSSIMFVTGVVVTRSHISTTSGSRTAPSWLMYWFSMALSPLSGVYAYACVANNRDAISMNVF
jgi:hypothetical protein